MDNLHLSEQEQHLPAVLQNARPLQPDARPDSVMNNLVDGLQNVSITVPEASPPAKVPNKKESSQQIKNEQLLCYREKKVVPDLLSNQYTAMKLNGDQRMKDLCQTQPSGKM